jgi:hypothetical protein
VRFGTVIVNNVSSTPPRITNEHNECVQRLRRDRGCHDDGSRDTPVGVPVVV